MTCVDDEGYVYGILDGVEIQYLEKENEGVVNVIGGIETPVFEHVWEFLKIIPLPQKSISAFATEFEILTEGVKKRMTDIEKEFGAIEILKNVVPLHDKLMVAIILYSFRHGFNLWNYSANSQSFDSFSGKNVIHEKQNVLKMAASLNINEFYHRLFLLLLFYLCEAGYVQLTPSPSSNDIDIIDHTEVQPTKKYFCFIDYSKLDECSDENPFHLSSLLLSKYPQTRPSVTLMMNAGMNLHEVIIKKEDALDPLALIFGDKNTADAVYRDDMEIRLYNYVVQAAFTEVLGNVIKNENPLQVLEVGAGTGGTTAYLFEKLDIYNTNFTYTDISRSFFAAAQDSFARYSSCIKYKVLDISKEPVDQDFDAESQDVIIAANVLHATKYIIETLLNVNKLLKPGGVLILFEALTLKWLDIVFGLTKGWWALEDTELRKHPLLTPEKWKSALTNTGFENVEVFNEWKNSVETRDGRLSVIVAQKSTRLSVTDSDEKFIETIKNVRFSSTAPSGTALIFVENTLILSPSLIFTFLKNNFIVLAVVREKKTMDILINSLKVQLDEKILLNNFFSLFVDNYHCSVEGYREIWNCVNKNKLPPVVSIVHAWSLDLPKIPSNEEELKHTFQVNLYSLLYFSHSLVLNFPSSSNPSPGTAFLHPSVSMWGITSGVWAVEQKMSSGEISLGQCCLWGYNRCLLNELSSVHPRAIDLSINTTKIEINSCIQIVCSEALNVGNVSGYNDKDSNSNIVGIDNNETELAIRGCKCYVQRLVQQDKSSTLHRWYLTQSAANSSYSLVVSGKKQLCLEERKRVDIVEADEVEVHVAAAGVSRRDLLIWNEEIPASFRLGGSVGNEFAGVITKIGSNVKDFKVGSRVFGVGRECISSFVVVNNNFIADCPKNYSFDQVGGIGYELLTAYYSLVFLGNVCKGNYVLIHSATGGFGLCAISLCVYFGAIPICTAGTVPKRRYLELLGIKHIFDSRDEAFSKDVLEATGGKGVDIVLNTLSGNTKVNSGLKCIGKRGKFIELNRSNIYNNVMIDISPLKSNVSYHVVAIDDLILEKDSIIGDILRKCSSLLESGAIHPPPVRVFPLSEVSFSYGFLEKSEHIGKVVLFPIAASFSPSSIPPERGVIPLSAQGCYVKSEGSYLVTGGTQGFSLELGIGLLERGCKHLILCSRTGLGDTKRQTLFDSLKKKYNADIVVKCCDVSSPSEIRTLLSEIRSSGFPLRGVIHGAMVLHDGYLNNLNEQAFWKVLAPKAFGAWIIHDDTIKHNDPIDLFVTLSSLNAVVGTPGQTNYGSANMFLDGLTLYRRSHNYPSLSMQWGVLGGVGYVHRNVTTVGENMASYGFHPLSSRWANRILHTCLQSQADLELERLGKIPSSPQSLTAYFTVSSSLLYDRLNSCFNNTPRFFTNDGDAVPTWRSLFNFAKKIKNPSCVPITVGVFNLEWPLVFNFMQGIKGNKRFELIQEMLKRTEKVYGDAKNKSGTEDFTSLPTTFFSSTSSSSISSANSIFDILTSSPYNKSISFLSKTIAEQTAKILGIGSETQVSEDIPLSQYGLDSMTSIDVKKFIEREIRVDVPVVDIVRGPSSEQLAKNVLSIFQLKYGKLIKYQEDSTSANVDFSQKSVNEGDTQSSSVEKSNSNSSTSINIQLKDASSSTKQTLLQVQNSLSIPRPTAFIFTGQSALKVGIGMDLYQQFPEAKKIWDECDQHFIDELGVSILKIIRENPVEYKVDFSDGEKGRRLKEKYMSFVLTKDENIMKEVWNEDSSISPKAFPTVEPSTECYTYKSPKGLLFMTHFAQPIIIIYEYVVLSILELNSETNSIVENSVYCGHSLGEYCALVSIGRIASAKEMAMTCFMRGMVMQTCVYRDSITSLSSYGMAAVSPNRVGNFFTISNLDVVIECIVNAAGGRLLQIVNLNVYNDQYVVSGERYCIWLLGDVLSYIHDNGENSLKGIGKYCYQSIAKHPYSATPFEIPKSKAVFPLAGIDVPFHSRLLRKVVPLFRSFLDSRLPPADQYSYVDRLVGKYITNIYSKTTFNISLEFARIIWSLSKSPYLLNTLGALVNPSLNESDVFEEGVNIPWLTLSKNEKARLILKECLSYQFASPVQWIDTQNTIISSGVEQIIEIGPTKTLASMFNKTLMKIQENVTERPNDTKKIDVLSFDTDRENLFKLFLEKNV
jgi:NADPH:quinone reductase-like Zn-dependent oxidoreductase/malonyl CoA-acyl carrier protein transacylase/SAM-dependent methyltransferase